MKTSIYKMTSEKIPGGAIYLNYKSGFLRAVDLADAQPTPEQLEYFLNILPVNEGKLGTVNFGSMKVAAIATRTVKDKIKLFCAAFREYRNVTYAPTQTEAANIRTVLVTPELLTVFFKTPLMDFTIRNYIARINVTRDVLKNGREIKDRFPDEFNQEFYNKLPPDRLMAYQKHLRDNGWQPIKGRGWVLNPTL